MARETIPELEALATIMVGDEGDPDVFFVSEEGAVFLITTEFDEAYQRWHTMAHYATGRRECALENRQFGVIASVNPDEERGNRLRVRDDSPLFLQQRRSEAEKRCEPSANG